MGGVKAILLRWYGGQFWPLWGPGAPISWLFQTLVHDANMKMAYYANLRKQDIDNFPIGTSVRISLDGVEFNKFRQRPSKKLNPIWYGPFTVTGRPSPISVEVKIPPDSSIHNVFTLARIKLASDEQFSNLRPTPLPNGEEEEGVYFTRPHANLV